MKKFYSLLFCLIPIITVSAQAPQFVNYQAVIWDSEGNPRNNENVTIEISITDAGGTTIYSEQHNAVTGNAGAVALKIGQGTATTGNFSDIQWNSGTYSVSVNVDGNDTGTSKLASVPYALFAEKAGNVPDVSELIKNPTIKIAGDFLSYDGTNWISKKLPATTGVAGASLPISNMQPYLALNYCIATEGLYPSRSMGAEPYMGSIGIFAGNFAPRGWLFCQGQILSIAQNTALFSLLGTTYGGNGQTTFALPDLRGKTIIGVGQGWGGYNYVLGEQGGSEQITLTNSNMPMHTHTISVLP
jgi:microcystin-dependent protein